MLNVNLSHAPTAISGACRTRIGKHALPAPASECVAAARTTHAGTPGLILYPPRARPLAQDESERDEGLKRSLRCSRKRKGAGVGTRAERGERRAEGTRIHMRLQLRVLRGRWPGGRRPQCAPPPGRCPQHARSRVLTRHVGMPKRRRRCARREVWCLES
ncbi:hypothetical protein PENSPDRAFT_446028 [Peniophora sp. CONT]|nr:hypothetical protein PENSPDRAFT_446028 [Peniophora sp. CONT]